MTSAEYTGLQKLILGVRDELKADIKNEVNNGINALRAEMNACFDENEMIQNEILTAIGLKHIEFERTDADHERRIRRLEHNVA